jgi:hypothetical protein
MSNLLHYLDNMCSPGYILIIQLFLSIANAWEEGDEVVLVTCRLQNPDLDQVNGATKEKLENFTNELYIFCFSFYLL